MKKRYVLKNKTRFIIIIAVLLTIISTIVMSSSVYGYKDTQYEVVKVKKGDTLWGIAERYNTKDDIRKFIYEIKSVNNLTGSAVFEGEELKLPRR